MTPHEPSAVAAEVRRARLTKLFASWLLVPLVEQNTDQQPPSEAGTPPDGRDGG